ncbi:MAG: YihY/virulence factor BrkB family protein [Bryobacteraceae bacterium]
MAKAAAYSALLSFFPVLTTAAAVLVEFRADSVSRFLLSLLFEAVPPGAEALVRDHFAARGHRPVLVLVGAGLLSVWAASGVVSSLMQGFQRAYGIARSRSILHNFAVSMMLVLLAAVPLVAASVLILFGGHVDAVLSRWLAGDAAVGWALVYRLSRYLVAIAATVCLTMVLYYFGPHRRQRWRLVWRGAVVATGLWLAATGAFGWYVRNLANYNVVYGSVATTVALLVWMFLMALVALVGCEFNALVERELLQNPE